MPAVLDRIRWAFLNALQACFLGVWSMFWMTVAIISCVVTRRSDVSLRMGRTRWAPGLLWAGGAKLDVRGLERVDFSKPCVFVVNHQSMLDIPVLFRALPVNLHFIAKKELFSVPFLGWYMTVSGMVPIDRRKTNDAVTVLKKSGARIAAGMNVIAFAEGTRSRTGAIGPFKKGAFMLAIEAQVPVVPVAIEGARDVLPSDGFSARPGSIRVELGEPIPTVGMVQSDRSALMARAHAEVVRLNLGLGGIGTGSVAVDLPAPAAQVTTQPGVAS
jgi:1-acyl-sn-glycerol-3-phosphate acyltransferase